MQISAIIPDTNRFTPSKVRMIAALGKKVLDKSIELKNLR